MQFVAGLTILDATQEERDQRVMDIITMLGLDHVSLAEHGAAAAGRHNNMLLQQHVLTVDFNRLLIRKWACPRALRGKRAAFPVRVASGAGHSP